MSQVMERITERLTYRTLRGSDLTVGMRYRAGNVVYTIVEIDGHRVTVMRPWTTSTGTFRLAPDARQYRVMHRGGTPVLFTQDVERYRGMVAR